MKLVWKFPVAGLGITDVVAPGLSRILCGGIDPRTDEPVVWAEVDPDGPVATRTVALVGTGFATPVDGAYVNTFIQGPFVWHLYTAPSPEVPS